MVRIKTTSFTRLKPTDLVVAAQANVDAVTEAGSVFEGIVPSASVVEAAVSDLSAKIALSKTGGTVSKNDRDSAATLVISCLMQWHGFVLALANSKSTPQEQLEVVESAAFEPASRGAKIGPLTAVDDPRAKGSSKQISIEWRKKKGAHSYKVMKTDGYATEKSVWTEHTITIKCKVSLEAKPGHIVSFIIFPIGAAGIGAQSKFVTAMATL